MAQPRTIIAARKMRADPEYAFDAIAHADALERISGGVRKVERVRDGSPEPYGAGAVRIVDLGPVMFEEETRVYDRPTRFEYLIHRARPPFTHHGGEYTVVPDEADGGCRVTWKSTVSIDVPVVGGALTFLHAASMRAGFISVLKRIDRNHARSRD